MTTELNAAATVAASDAAAQEHGRAKEMLERLLPPEYQPDRQGRALMISLMIAFARAELLLTARAPIDPNIVYPGKDSDFVFPEE